VAHDHVGGSDARARSSIEWGRKWEWKRERKWGDHHVQLVARVRGCTRVRSVGAHALHRHPPARHDAHVRLLQHTVRHGTLCAVLQRRQPVRVHRSQPQLRDKSALPVAMFDDTFGRMPQCIGGGVLDPDRERHPFCSVRQRAGRCSDSKCADVRACTIDEQ
jgi:hypothetical protein